MLLSRVVNLGIKQTRKKAAVVVTEAKTRIVRIETKTEIGTVEEKIKRSRVGRSTETRTM
jgi:hypothetical protein